jgi:phage terminase large subunit
MQLAVNKKFQPFITDQNYFNILKGGAGSGKSVAAAQKIIVRCLSESNNRFLIVRKVYSHLKDSVFTEIKTQIQKLGLEQMGYRIYVRNSPLEVHIGSNEIKFKGLDDPEKIKSISGVNSVWIEEATEITKEDFEQLLLRVRGESTNYKQFILSFNPVSTANWVYNYFYSNPTAEILNNSSYYHSTYLDNYYVGKEYEMAMQQLKERNPTYYQVYALGEWGQKGDVIYDNFEYREQISSRIRTLANCYYGLDFGYNDPCVLIRVYQFENTLYLEELIYESGLTNSQFIDRIKKFKIDKSSPFYADAAEPDRIQEIYQAGYNVYKAKKDVQKGIDTVKNFNIITKYNNKNTNKELLTYSWKKDKEGNLLDKPVDGMDPLRYAVYTHNKNSNLANRQVYIIE